MNRDDIIRMAREAGAWDYYEINGDKYSDYSPLEKFAAFVAAAEREACAKVCDEVEKRKWLTVQNGGKLDGVGARHCAEAIRARGEK